jgi:signal transduction histidine kinase
VASSREAARALSQPDLLVGVRLAALGLLVWGISTEVAPGATSTGLATWVLVATLVPAWLGWSTPVSRLRWVRLLSFAWMALAGGALAALAPLGLVFVGSAGLGAASRMDLVPAAGLTALGPLATAVAGVWDGRPAGWVLSTAAAGLAGVVMGAGRRQATARAEQEALVHVEHHRADVERAKAAVLAERNRLAREVHDVLAHTLGALAVQLEALDAQIGEHGDVPETFRRGVRQTRSLAVDGLAEARRAVSALREDALPLGSQLAELCELRNARLSVSGEERELPAETTLALYRVAQEALTNAAKHAPGAPVAVTLRFDADGVTLDVENGFADHRRSYLASTGGGFGLEGIRERVRLLGGSVAAGTRDDRWVVQARVPG